MQNLYFDTDIEKPSVFHRFNKDAFDENFVKLQSKANKKSLFIQYLDYNLNIIFVNSKDNLLYSNV